MSGDKEPSHIEHLIERKALRSEAQVEAARNDRYNSRVTGINEFVDALTKRHRDSCPEGEACESFVPWIDPCYGGAGAPILLLLNDPGKAGSERSHFLSARNADRTAPNMFDCLRGAVLGLSDVTAWNAFPYVLKCSGFAKRKKERIAQGVEVLERLLVVPIAAHVVVLMGDPAARCWRTLELTSWMRARKYSVLHTYHPFGAVGKVGRRAGAAAGACRGDSQGGTPSHGSACPATRLKIRQQGGNAP